MFNDHAITTVAWGNLEAPKEFRGLGFGSIKMMIYGKKLLRQSITCQLTFFIYLTLIMPNNMVR